jgi:hypothetical protein
MDVNVNLRWYQLNLTLICSGNCSSTLWHDIFLYNTWTDSSKSSANFTLEHHFLLYELSCSSSCPPQNLSVLINCRIFPYLCSQSNNDQYHIISSALSPRFLFSSQRSLSLHLDIYLISIVFFLDIDRQIPRSFLYHQICKNNASRPFCFYDETYLCLCRSSNYRAQCFIHNPQIDHCDKCLSGGQCLQGNPNDNNDFCVFVHHVIKVIDVSSTFNHLDFLSILHLSLHQQ